MKRKRDEIFASIRMYEKKIAQARADMAHVAAAIRIFEASDRPADLARYVDHYRLFKRGEPWAICAKVLAAGPQDTKQLALALMAANTPREIECPKCEAHFLFCRTLGPRIDSRGFEAYLLECPECGVQLAGIIDPSDEALLHSEL